MSRAEDFLRELEEIRRVALKKFHSEPIFTKVEPLFRNGRELEYEEKLVYVVLAR